MLLCTESALAGFARRASERMPYTPSMSTLVCVPIMVTDEAAALRDALRARDAAPT